MTILQNTMPKKVLLVIDADPSTLRKVKSALSEAEWGVLHVRSAVEGETICEQQTPGVVIVALTLVGANSYDLCRRIRSLHPTSRIVLVHGGFDLLDAARARASGVDLTLRKPLAIESLKSIFEEVAAEPVALDSQDTTAGPASGEMSDPHLHAAFEEVPAGSIQPLDEPAPAPWDPLDRTDREATFIPASVRKTPRPDRTLDPEIERAILSVLPEVVELVLRKMAREPGPVRDLIRETVIEAVRGDGRTGRPAPSASTTRRN